MTILKKNLRLTSKTFDDAMQEILPRKREQLPLDFFSNQPYCKLDFSPIYITDEVKFNFTGNLFISYFLTVHSHQVLRGNIYHRDFMSS